jgi:hypothetical protein
MTDATIALTAPAVPTSRHRRLLRKPSQCFGPSGTMAAGLVAETEMPTKKIGEGFINRFIQRGKPK